MSSKPAKGRLTFPRRPGPASLARAEQARLFDLSPIEIGNFRLTAHAATPIQKPTLAQYQAALEFAREAGYSSPFWIGDLVNYAKGRKEWEEARPQVEDATGYAGRTLDSLGYVSSRVGMEARRRAPSVGHAAVVVTMEPDEQEEWLDQAATEGWTVAEFRAEVRASKRRKIVAGQATLDGMFRVIYADPPWLYNDSGATADGSLGKAARHYPGMTIEQLCKLPVGAHVMPSAVLFLWVTAPFLLLNPGPRDVLEAWGFDYKTNLTWDKVLGMPSHYGLQTTHEHLLVCTRGSCQPDVPLPHLDSVFTERRTDVHSEKPAEIRRWITTHWTTGPYLELFASKPVAGWTCFGNDARLWAGDAERSA